MAAKWAPEPVSPTTTVVAWVSTRYSTCSRCRAIGRLLRAACVDDIVISWASQDYCGLSDGKYTRHDWALAAFCNEGGRGWATCDCAEVCGPSALPNAGESRSVAKDMPKALADRCPGR